jgi:hypothetical protein
MLRHSLIGAILAALTIGLVGTTSSAGGKLEPVKMQASLAKSTSDKQVVLVELKIAKGWHIYANPVGLEDLASAETVVKVKSGGKLIAAKIDYPAGRLHKEKGIGEFKIYENDVKIRAEVAKTSAPLEVSVTFQACDATKCLQPKTLKVNVK